MHLPHALLGVITQFFGAWAFMPTSKAGERLALLPDVFVCLLTPGQLGEFRGAFELVDGLDVAAELAGAVGGEARASRKVAVAANGSVGIGLLDVFPIGGKGGVGEEGEQEEEGGKVRLAFPQASQKGIRQGGMRG
jgi:hypothetical protein